MSIEIWMDYIGTRPMGTNSFIEKLEQKLVRVLQPQKPGPKKQEKGS